MITNFETKNVLNVQIMGLSTDTKPTTGVQPYSLFWELDTNGMYFFDGTQWQPIGGSGGGGGESDFSTATLHIVNNTEGSAVIGSCALIDPVEGYTYPSVYMEEEEKDFTVVLGNEGADLHFLIESFTYTTTGDIERTDPEYPDFTITGDCTITVTQTV